MEKVIIKEGIKEVEWKNGSNCLIHFVVRSIDGIEILSSKVFFCFYFF